jgi:flavorubredoxin
MFPKKKKYVYNFFLTEEEKQLIFTLKHLHRLNNRLGKTDENYSSFIEDMTSYYNNILMDFNPNQVYADKNQNQ